MIATTLSSNPVQAGIDAREWSRMALLAVQGTSPTVAAVRLAAELAAHCGFRVLAFLDGGAR